MTTRVIDLFDKSDQIEFQTMQKGCRIFGINFMILLYSTI